MSRSRLTYIFILLLVLLPFQNCTPTGQVGRAQSAASSGPQERTLAGGQGYDGKVSYISRAFEHSCADGDPVRAKIEVLDGKAQIVREACTDVAPIPVTLDEIALMTHNPNNAIHGDRVFDLLEDRTNPLDPEAVSTKYMCRGRYPNKSTGELQVADVMIRYKNGGALAFSAQVIMAVYDKAGVLKTTLNSGELELRNIDTSVPGRVKYVTSIVGRHAITLWIDKSGDPKTGKLSFIDLPYAGRQNESGYNFRDYERVIQSLQCFVQ